MGTGRNPLLTGASYWGQWQLASRCTWMTGRNPLLAGGSYQSDPSPGYYGVLAFVAIPFSLGLLTRAIVWMEPEKVDFVSQSPFDWGFRRGACAPLAAVPASPELPSDQSRAMVAAIPFSSGQTLQPASTSCFPHPATCSNPLLAGASEPVRSYEFGVEGRAPPGSSRWSGPPPTPQFNQRTNWQAVP